MLLGSNEELSPAATLANTAFKCTACGKKCTPEFNRDMAIINGDLHDECTYGGNVVQD